MLYLYIYIYRDLSLNISFMPPLCDYFSSGRRTNILVRVESNIKHFQEIT